MATNTFSPAFHLRGPGQSYGATRNRFAQQEARQRRNRLLDLEEQRIGRVNALMDDPNASAEQFARAGRADISNSSIGSRQNERALQAAEGNQQRQAIGILSGIAQKLLTIPDPARRRAATKNIMNNPGYRKLFESIGADVSQGNVDSIDDATLQQGLEQWAAFGPQSQSEIGPLIEPIPGRPADKSEALSPMPRPLEAQEITATGPNGEKVVLRNGRWMLLDGR